MTQKSTRTTTRSDESSDIGDLLALPSTLAALLNAAIDAMAEQGYHGTSIRDIADRANVGSATMYYHFPSKQDLLAALMRISHEEHFQRLQDALLESDIDPVSRLTALTRTQVLAQIMRRNESFVARTELRSLEPQNRAIVDDKRAAIQRLFDNVIKQGASTGVFHTPFPYDASRAVVMMCTTVSDWYLPGGPMTGEELAAVYVQLALATVMAESSGIAEFTDKN